ncbi:MAG: HRDC domain-containing protein, partial [Bacteroidales bacterium]|nr:HRDC domain-containing protein [Bacteroidales bacterium]
QTFNDNVINNFCLNKKVHNIKSEFFSQNNKTFWSVAITYDEILKPEEKPKQELTETQKKLYQKLREWRAGRAEKDGIPVFLVAKNIQLEEIVKNKCVSLECLKNIKGIGNGKTSKYGNEIINLVKTFYEQNT